MIVVQQALPNVLAVFAAGAEVGAYGGALFDSGTPAPIGPPLDSAVVDDDGRLFFDSLPEAGTTYYAAAKVGGEWRLLAFTTPEPPNAIEQALASEVINRTDGDLAVRAFVTTRALPDLREWVGYAPSEADKGAEAQAGLDSIGDELVMLPPWPIVTSQPLEYYGGSTLLGQGMSSGFKLGDNSDCDILRPAGYGAGGQDDYRLERFVVDGNAAHNVAGGGILSDGRKVQLLSLWAHDCVADGIFHQQSAADLPKQAGGMDLFARDLRAWHNTRDGIFIEHHDSILDNCQCINNGRANLHLGALAYATKLFLVHCWGLAEYEVWAQASFQAFGCEAEGGEKAQVRCDSGGTWIGGAVFTSPSNLNVPGFLLTSAAARLLTRGTGFRELGTGGAIAAGAAFAGSGSSIDGLVDGPGQAFTKGAFSFSGSINAERLRLRTGATPGDWPAYEVSTTGVEKLSLEQLAGVKVTGLGEIKEIAPLPPYWTITLRCTVACKFIDNGGSLNLNGNFEGPGNLTLQCDGTNWTEISRSKN